MLMLFVLRRLVLGPGVWCRGLQSGESVAIQFRPAQAGDTLWHWY